MRKFRIILLLGVLMTGIHPLLPAQDLKERIPIFGAQVFIEPGQTPEEIDSWFRTLKENNMPLCRIRMFESYMKKADGSWDFSLFDNAFRAAEKYGVKIYSTLFPYTEKTDIGGFKFPRDEQHLQSIAEYIRQMVTHFKQYKSLYGWVLINEPGSGSIPKNEFAAQKLKEWKIQNPPKECTDKGFPVLMNLSDQHFLMDYNTWFLTWIASEIRKYDSKNYLHVNNHAIFSNAAEYNFPEWRKFLNSLGGSAHASWHFGYFNRDQYAVAMSANSEIVRSGAGSLPWFMTEIQGGNNTYSGNAPFCPTQEEIAQWMWIVVGTEAKGGIFWSLNPRSSGVEAGEWGMLTFQDKSSDRLTAASLIATTINNNAQLFSEAKEIDSGINILYIRESMWAEKAMATPSFPNYEGRNTGAVIKSALGYFEALCEMGINCNMKAFGEFDFSKEDFSGQTIILANQISVPNSYADELNHFVSHGGKLLVDGLTAFFDENLHNTMKTGFAFEKLFGGNISEFKLVDNLFNIEIASIKIPAHLWKGSIVNEKGAIESCCDSDVFAIRNKVGKGQVVWIPSLIGLGSRIAKDYNPLSQFLYKEILQPESLFRFTKPIPGLLMKTMKSGNSFITFVINKKDHPENVELFLAGKKLKPNVLYANHGSVVSEGSYKFMIEPEETIVIRWN